MTHFIRRETAICNYSVQLGVMERLKHELLLLHTKVSVYGSEPQVNVNVKNFI